MNGSAPGNGPSKQLAGLSIVCTGKQGPVPEGSAVVPCPACFQPILPGQSFTTIPIGPGGDPAKRAAARMSLPHQPVFVAVHWACVTGDESESRLAL